MHAPFSSDTFPARNQPLPRRLHRPARHQRPPTPDRNPGEAPAAAKPSGRTPGTPNPDSIDDELTQLEAARLAQLHTIRELVRDAVSGAYRDSVVRALEKIRGARERVAAGTYGLCTCCGNVIAPERLELIPSAPLCVDCAVHTRAG